MKLYEVKAKCGHVGRKFYAMKSFAIKAENGREAAAIVRFIPRVKHHHKDAILDVQEIDEVRYWELIKANNEDPYFRCKSVQDQRSYSDPDIYVESTKVSDDETDHHSNKAVCFGKTRVKKPRKFVRNYFMEEVMDYGY